VVNKTSVFPKIKHTQAFPLEIYLSSFDLYISSEIHIEEFNTKLILIVRLLWLPDQSFPF